jgi:probable F420-dependent oxidoreductase
MKFSVGIPIDEIEPAGEFQTGEALREMALAIERLGFDACFVTDHPAPTYEWLHGPASSHDALDPFSALSFVAAHTSRLKVHANVVVLPYRNPFVVAKAATTLQVLSGGRFIMGVSPGFMRGEFEALGVDPKRRGALTDEALETIRMIWTGEPVTKQGLTFNAQNIHARPAPATKPPIWVGGGSEKAAQRAALHGDGWAPFFAYAGANAMLDESALTSIEQFRERLARLQETRAEAGRTGPFDVILSPRVKLELGTREGADKYIAGLQDMAVLGVTWAPLRFRAHSRREYLDQIQWFSEEVIARLPKG